MGSEGPVKRRFRPLAYARWLVGSLIAVALIQTAAIPLPAAGQASPCARWVAPRPAGNDANPGTITAPWATLQHAADAVPDSGCTVWIADGRYSGGVDFERRFRTPTRFKAVNDYGATMVHTSTVIDLDGARNVVIEGLEITHSGPGSSSAVVDFDEGDGQWTEDVVLRNNVIHDSFDNDLLKIHRGVRFATVEGNLFYNQGPSEQQIDLNSVTDITIQDNVFFNDYAASNRSAVGSKHFIVVKDPNATEDGVLGSQRITIRRNVFFNWQGGKENFLKVGNDGKPIHEAVGVSIQSNLLIGNSSSPAVAAFGVAGAKNVSFVNNTIVGDLPSSAFGFRVETKRENPVNENIQFVNNIWADPTGTMGSDGESDDLKFATGDPAETHNFVLATNLYWNGGAPIPTGPLASPLIDDRSAIVADPLLATDHSSIVPPVKTGDGFADGSTSIREVFIRLVQGYGALASGSPAIGAADPAKAPADDILGNKRSDPDLGAYEAGSKEPAVPTPPSSSPDPTPPPSSSPDPGPGPSWSPDPLPGLDLFRRIEPDERRHRIGGYPR